MVLPITLLLGACYRPHQTGRQQPTGPELAISWNETAYRVAYAHDQFYSFIGVRALAMTHLAMHDALNAVQPRYARFLYQEHRPEADPVAAAAQAAYEVLAAAYPQRKDTLSQVLGHWLGQVPDGPAKEQGILSGRAIAHQLIAFREGDGHEKNGDYTPMTKPGDYRFTPGFDYVWKPDFDYARPFVLDSVSEFRVPPPPPLDSEAYTKSFEEVKAYGGKNSRERQPDQAHFAHWWAEFGEHSWNRIGRLAARDQALSLVDANRLFALINVNLYDLYLASFDSKYQYDTWRPITAIHEADQDGNPATEADPSWEPEMITPPWPEYPSAHAAVGAGGAEVVSTVLGSPAFSFTMVSTTAQPAGSTRTYADLDAAADDCADSRIMNGFHFRFATEAGKIQGRQVARKVCATLLQPLEGQ